MKNNALSIANEFIDLAENEPEFDLTPLKLMKLVYIAHGIGMVYLDGKMIDDRFDVVEAWKLGPVIPSVYHTFKHRRNNQLNLEDKAVVQTDINDFEIPKLTGETEKKVVKFTWNRYKTLSASELVELLHQPNTPWAECYRVYQNCIIPDEKTKFFYTELIRLLEIEYGYKHN